MVLVELGFVTSGPNGTNRPINAKARDFKRVDWKVFQQHLLFVDWDRVFAHSKVDAVWNSFLHELNEILDEVAPTKRIRNCSTHCGKLVRFALLV